MDINVLKGTTLVIGSHGVGLSPHIGMDLFILNAGMERLGFYKSELITPIIINDVLTTAGEAPGKISMPAEIWHSQQYNMTFLLVRSSVKGGMRSFTDELIAFVKSCEFANVAVLTATMSPIKRERDSNRQIPEVFAYMNNFLYK